MPIHVCGQGKTRWKRTTVGDREGDNVSEVTGNKSEKCFAKFLFSLYCDTSATMLL